MSTTKVRGARLFTGRLSIHLDLDSLSDAEYAALQDDCDADRHPIGTCPLCADGWDDAPKDPIAGLWGDWDGIKAKGSQWGSAAPMSRINAPRTLEALANAHKVCKSFIDTFATGDLRYDVTFDPTVKTAGTDFGGRKVVITPAPALDPTIDAQTAGTVLTGMAVHEASHVRYGRPTAAAVRKVYAGTPWESIAHNLGNLLDDVRIERSFVRDYPGFAGVFAPTLAYVSAGAIKDAGGSYAPTLAQPVGFAAAAVRYATEPGIAWAPDTLADRDWWQAWGQTYTATDSPKVHVAGVAAAIARIEASQPQAQPDPGPGPQGQPGAGGGTGESQGQAAQDDATDPQDDATSSQAAPGEDGGQDATPGAGAPQDATGEDAQGQAPGTPDGSSPLPVCVSDGVQAAAVANGVDPSAIDGAAAQEAVNVAATIVQIGGVGVDVRPVSALRRARALPEVDPSTVAAAVIRDAFMRSRSGHDGRQRNETRGRVDSRSLYRVANVNDQRLFHRRTAVSPGRFSLWVMVDMSGSMSGQPTLDVIAMAKSLAQATRSIATLRMGVYGWTTAAPSGAKLGAYAGVYRVWQTGQDIGAIDDLSRIDQQGTPDVPVMGYAAQAARKDAKGAEQPIVIMMSDGMGYHGMAETVESARAAGVRVISVAIGEDVREDRQRATYGEGNYVAWAGSIDATARPLAAMLARIVA